MIERELTYAGALQVYQSCKNEFKEISSTYKRDFFASMFIPWMRIELPKTTYHRLIALEGTLETISNAPAITKEAEIAEENDTDCSLDEINELYEKIERYKLRCSVIS